MAIVATGQISIVDLNDSKQLQLFIGCNQPKTQIFNPNGNSYTPNWTTNKPVLTPQLFIAGSSSDIISSANSITWYEAGSNTPISSNTNYTIPTSGLKTLTINTNILSNKNSQLFICEVVYTDPVTNQPIVAKADFEFIKVTNGIDGQGANATTGVLSNDSHVIPTDSAGNNGIFTGATTTLTIYEGTTDVSNQWTVTQTRTNVTVTEATSSKTATVTAMSADVGYVEFTATRTGYANIVKRFTLSKAKGGVSGTTPTAYWLISDAGAIKKSASGVFTPSTVTFTAKSQTGTGSPANYNGRWIIATTTNGTSWTDTATSTTNEATKSQAVSGSIIAVRARLYLAGGTTNLLDEQIVPVIADGTNGNNGNDAVMAVVSTPNGNMIKNGTGSLTAKVDIYKGGATVTGTAFKWYIQDPTATTSSGGDADGGAGWRLLNSTTNYGITGYTTNTITIPASAIASLESFKCVATYNGVKYSDVCTVVDITDPIAVVIVGTNIFKNGEGTTSMTAKLYRNGDEIDSGGTEYTYKWALYNSNGTQNTSFGTNGIKTGKTITVSASDVTGRANLICEVE